MTTGETGYADKPMRKQFTLFWGVAAQFSYVGAQVGVAAYFINYFTQARPDLSVTEAHVKGANFYAIAQGLFAAGRFAAAGLMYFGGKPRIVLLVFQTMIMIFIAAAIGTNTGGATGANWGGLAMLMIVLFFESCIFPIIFALSLVSHHPGSSFTERSIANTCSAWIGPPHQARCFLPRLLGLRWCHCARYPRKCCRQDWHQACHVHSPHLL